MRAVIDRFEGHKESVMPNYREKEEWLRKNIQISGSQALKGAATAVLPQPFLFLPVVRHDALHNPPETVGVVHLHKMRQLMDAHVVEDGIRCKEQSR